MVRDERRRVSSVTLSDGIWHSWNNGSRALLEIINVITCWTWRTRISRSKLLVRKPALKRGLASGSVDWMWLLLVEKGKVMPMPKPARPLKIILRPIIADASLGLCRMDRMVLDRCSSAAPLLFVQTCYLASESRSTKANTLIPGVIPWIPG
jgi:hypothetical protein